MEKPNIAAAAAAEIPEGSRHDLRHDLSPDAPEIESYSEGEGAFGYVAFVRDRLASGRARHPDHALPLRLPAALPVLPQSGHVAPEARRARVRWSASSPGSGTLRPALRLDARRADHLRWRGAGAARVHAAHLAPRRSRIGLHTALETSGFLGARATEEYLQSVDLVILDIKSWDPETYRRVTRQEVGPTLRSPNGSRR